MKLLMLILLIELVECTLISKSILERCTDGPSEPKGGNGKTCAKKFVVSITLRSDQVRASPRHAVMIVFGHTEAFMAKRLL